MRDVIITLIIFGGIPFVFARPWIGILLFSWVSYMNPHRLTYGFAYSFQFALIIALVTIIAYAISREPKKIPVTPVTTLLLMFIAWTSITTVTALAPEASSTQYTTFIKIQLMTFLALTMMISRERLNWLIIIIVVSIGFYGVRGGVFSILTGGNYRVWGPAGSFFEDNNHLALTLIMTMPFMHYLQLVADNKWKRHLLSGVMLLTLVAIIGTYSRGALLALAAMSLVLWLRSSKKFVIGLAGIVCVVGVLSMMPQKWFDRMDTINTYKEDESASGRLDAWLFAINVANDRVLGGGFKVNTRADIWPIYNPEAPTHRAPHSIYFEVLGEHGWIGLFIFLSLGATAFFTCGRTVKLTKNRPDLKWAADLSKMMQVSLVGYAAAGTFLNLSTFDLYYHVLAIIVMTRYLVGLELKVPVANLETPEGVDPPAHVAEASGGPQNGRQPEPGREKIAPNPQPSAEGNLGGASGYLIKRR